MAQVRAMSNGPNGTAAHVFSLPAGESPKRKQRTVGPCLRCRPRSVAVVKDSKVIGAYCFLSIIRVSKDLEPICRVNPCCANLSLAFRVANFRCLIPHTLCGPVMGFCNPRSRPGVTGGTVGSRLDSCSRVFHFPAIPVPLYAVHLSTGSSWTEAI